MHSWSIDGPHLVNVHKVQLLHSNASMHDDEFWISSVSQLSQLMVREEIQKMMMIMQQAWLQTFASIEIRFFEPNGPFFHFFRSIRILASSQQQQRRTNSAHHRGAARIYR